MRYTRNALLDDGSVIKHFRDVVRRRADDFHAAIESLLVWLGAHEGWQKRMMDIDDLLRILRDEVLGEHLHIARQNDQLDIVLAKQFDLLLLSLELVLLSYGNEVIRNLMKICVTFRVRMIADHQRDFAREFADPLPVEQVD